MINGGPAIHLRSHLSSGFHWIRVSGPGRVWAALICCSQIYGYASSVCTKEKWLLCRRGSLPSCSSRSPGPRGPLGARVSSCECQHCYFIRLTERDLLLSLHLGINKRSPAGCGSAQLVCEEEVKAANGGLIKSRSSETDGAEPPERKQILAHLFPNSTGMPFES